MNRGGALPIKLHEIFSFIESKGSLDDILREQAALAAKVLNVEHCVIALLCEGEADRAGLRPGARFGDAPRTRWEVAGICGDAARESPPNASTAHPRSGVNADCCEKSSMYSAMVLNGSIIGVIQAHCPNDKQAFNAEDLKLLDVLALFITKSVQVTQLQNILNSRFAQIALAQTTEKTVSDVIVSSAQNPNQLAKILAKSFYREMTKMGFSRNQIIHAASEIISELSESLRKHSKGHKAPIPKPEPDQDGRHVQVTSVDVPPL